MRLLRNEKNAILGNFAFYNHSLVNCEKFILAFIPKKCWMVTSNVLEYYQIKVVPKLKLRKLHL